MLNSENPKRVLHVVSAMNRGGTETLLMNVYRNMDKSKIQFDFVSHRNEKCDYDDEITSLGGSVYRVSSLGQIGPAAYVKELKKVISNNHYIAVHAHTDYQCGFPALAAKISGIKRRICHSHSNHFPKGNGLKERLILKVLKRIIRYSATEYCACSTEAAHFLFGKRTVDNNKVHFLKNGIEVSQFANMDVDCHSSVKQELSIPMDAKVIGHIGHFSESKNHVFILKVLKEILRKDRNVFVVLVGDGPLRHLIEEKAKELELYNHIRFLGVRTDIPRLMKAFNAFLFPSLYEGFGIVMLEAQSSGTPCVVSDGVPKSTDMDLDLVSFVSLTESLDTWVEAIDKAIKKQRPTKELVINRISKLGFDIKSTVPEWVDLYG